MHIQYIMYYMHTLYLYNMYVCACILPVSMWNNACLQLSFSIGLVLNCYLVSTCPLTRLHMWGQKDRERERERKKEFIEMILFKKIIFQNKSTLYFHLCCERMHIHMCMNACVYIYTLLSAWTGWGYPAASGRAGSHFLCLTELSECIGSSPLFREHRACIFPSENGRMRPGRCLHP